MPSIPPTPNLHVIETDVRFANYRDVMSSDYMLSKISQDSQQVHKRLGDGFYEQKLINDQITQLTGWQYLAGYDNTGSEYQALMDNGVKAATSFYLVPSIALTSQQRRGIRGQCSCP